MKAKPVARNLLLGFVLVSIGFALGREATLRSARQRGVAEGAVQGDKLLVYYLHATIRCVTCNKIERMAKEVVERDFAREVAAGRVEWRTANFQEDEALAKKYDVSSSVVVLVRVKDGREAGFRRLDEVWAFVDDPGEFARFVSDEIRKQLSGGG